MNRSDLYRAPCLQFGRLGSVALGLGIAIAIAALVVPRSAAAESHKRDFATAEQAAEALVAANRANDEKEILRILGPDGEKLVHSGDPVADREGRERFVDAYDKAHKIELQGAGTAMLIIGPENWSLPIPIIKRHERWRFDTDAAVQKILDRRVGRNELNVIEVCRAHVAAQREYASKDRLGNGLHEYAQKFKSSPGRHDGLYWEASQGEEQSPIGPQAVSARAEGYAKDEAAQPSPYHGYVYRILTRQGPHAPRGAKDYIVNGHMTGGFALLAYPARWGDSGVMTFIVNQDGIVFQKNLGPDTASLAAQITQYDPDSSWTTP
jgi:hypothetical protein